VNKLLYATDFSGNAQRALPFAIRIAEKFSSELIMLHVFEIPTAWKYSQTEDVLQMERQAIEMSEGQLKTLLEKYEVGLEPRFVASGNTSVANGIFALLKEEDPDLIVIGTRGGSKLREFIVGSTTKELIKKSPVPVLAVPENALEFNLKKILYASDFQEEDIDVLRQLIDFARPFGAEITVVHVSTHEEYHGDEKMQHFKGAVKNKFGYEKIDFQLLLSDQIVERLNDFVIRNNYHLLAMLEKERDGLIGRLFHRDHVKKMEFHTSIPLLSFNEHYLKLKRQ
jgi:nucleotide-binding universal stress UspA family protein